MEEKFLLLLAFYLLLRKLSPWRLITRHHYRVIITTTYATVTFLSWSVIYEFSMLRISCKSVTNTLACYWWPFSTKPFCNPLQYMAHSCNMQYIGKGVTWNHIESHLLYTFWFLQSWNMDIVIPRTHIDHTLFPTLSNLTLWYCINIGLNIRIPETALNCDASPHTKLDSKAYILVYNRKPFTSFFSLLHVIAAASKHKLYFDLHNFKGIPPLPDSNVSEQTKCRYYWFDIFDQSLKPR